MDLFTLKNLYKLFFLFDFLFENTGLKSIRSKFPDVHILTSEIHTIVPSDFGQRYFGTE
jgi:hypothetical protein